MASTEAHKRASKEWYAKNLAKAKAVRAAYYQANKERMRELNQAWKAANQDRLKEHPSRKDWRKYENPENHRRWREKNKDKVNAKNRVRLATDERYRVFNRQGAARKRRATAKWADKEKIGQFYLEAVRLTETTGIKHHVDHIVPLKHGLVSGLHNEFNLRVVEASVNLRKHNKFEVT